VQLITSVQIGREISVALASACTRMHEVNVKLSPTWLHGGEFIALVISVARWVTCIACALITSSAIARRCLRVIFKRARPFAREDARLNVNAFFPRRFALFIPRTIRFSDRRARVASLLSHAQHRYSPSVAYVREMDFKLPMHRDYLGERINNDALQT